jgi:hypothetical protein
MLDDNTYPTGLRISDQQMRNLLRRHMTRHQFHGDWNYDIHPTADDDHDALAAPITATRPNKRQLCRPACSGVILARREPRKALTSSRLSTLPG